MSSLTPNNSKYGIAFILLVLVLFLCMSCGIEQDKPIVNEPEQIQEPSGSLDGLYQHIDAIMIEGGL